MNREYEKSSKAASVVSERIGRIESVAVSLFKEWQKEELKQYESKMLRRSNEDPLKAAKVRDSIMLRPSVPFNPNLQDWRVRSKS